MSSRHISFSRLEAGDAVDQVHLDSCGRCRQAHRVLCFLRTQLLAAPELTPPASFASRVAMIAEGARRLPFALALQYAAKRLIPVFAALVMSTSFLLYQLSQQSPSNLNSDVSTEILSEEVTLEEAVNSLRRFSEEGFLSDESD